MAGRFHVHPRAVRALPPRRCRRLTWVYNTYYERSTGTVMAGYHRSVYFDPYLRAYRMYYRPVLADTYVQEKEERIRIIFEKGKATVIEQAKGD